MALTWKHYNLTNKMIRLQLTITIQYQRINTKTMKTKTNKYTRRFEHLKNIVKIDKYKKLNGTSTREHKTEYNYTLVNQATNIRSRYF